MAPASIELHRRLIDALGIAARPGSPEAVDARPLELVGSAPLPARMRIYLYRMTTHESERQPGAYRIQVTLPGLRRGGERGHLDHSDDAFVLLAGYNADLDVFAFWDAGLIDTVDGIPFSRGCQVHHSTLYAAMNHGVAEQERSLRGQSTRELVVAARASAVVAGIERRWVRTVERLAPRQAAS